MNNNYEEISGKIMLGAMMLGMATIIFSDRVGLFFWGIFSLFLGLRLFFGMGSLFIRSLKTQEYFEAVLLLLAVAFGLAAVFEGAGLIFGIENFVLGISAPSDPRRGIW